MPIKNTQKYDVAEKKATMVRMIWHGVDGSGKTFTGLKLARMLAGDNGDILVIDTETAGEDVPRSGQYDQFGHYIKPVPYTELMRNKSVCYDNFIKAVKEGLESGAEVVIIDSWSDENEFYLSQAKATGDNNKYYNNTKPKRKELNQYIANAPCHVIILQRSSEQAEWQEDRDGRKTRVKRMALQPLGSGDVGYAINVRCAMEERTLRVVKTIYDSVPMDAEFDMTDEDKFVEFYDRLITGLDEGAATAERFKIKLMSLGFPPSEWKTLWEEVDGLSKLGRWSPENNDKMLELIEAYAEANDGG